MPDTSASGSIARWPLAVAAPFFLALAGCASVPPQTKPAAEAWETSQDDAGAVVVRHALDMVGVPYRYGGSTPRGFDCSGLVQYSYALAGIPLPRDMAGLWSGTRAVSMARLRPGDLLFFNLDGHRNSHVGLYIGNGRFVHAPSSGKFVSTESLSNPYWHRRLSGTRRAIFDERPPAVPAQQSAMGGGD